MVLRHTWSQLQCRRYGEVSIAFRRSVVLRRKAFDSGLELYYSVSIAFRRSVVLRPVARPMTGTATLSSLHCLSAFSGPSTYPVPFGIPETFVVSIAFRRSVVLRPKTDKNGRRKISEVSIAFRRSVVLRRRAVRRAWQSDGVSIAFRRSVVLRQVVLGTTWKVKSDRSPLPFGVQWSFDWDEINPNAVAIIKVSIAFRRSVVLRQIARSYVCRVRRQVSIAFRRSVVLRRQDQLWCNQVDSPVSIAFRRSVVLRRGAIHKHRKPYN